MESFRLAVVLAEDDDGHATLIRRNLERSASGVRVTRVRDGRELMDYLELNGAAGNPLLVLLDIKMPRMDGIEALERIKTHPQLRSVPVYMLTTTDNPVEVNRCFELGCNAYMMKPVAYTAFTTAIERLCSFLEITHLPAAPTDVDDVSA